MCRGGRAPGDRENAVGGLPEEASRLDPELWQLEGSAEKQAEPRRAGS